MKQTHLCIFLFVTLSTISQNRRDLKIHESIYNDIYFLEKYDEVKSNILALEEKYGYEPNLKYILLQKSFEAGDLAFFKDELTILVREYGFNIIYEPESKIYYESITTGNLSEWFKEMYLSNHFIWMENNFLKQIDLKKLNQLKDNDQLIVKYQLELKSKMEWDSIQTQTSTKILDDASFENLGELYSITRKYNAYPSDKNFALVQNNFYIVEHHNFQSKQNFEKTWILFEPFYKKAYLSNEIDYVVFLNYDNWSYVHNGYQKFGLLKVENIPEVYKKENLDTVPIIDLEYYSKIRNEFNWKK